MQTLPASVLTRSQFKEFSKENVRVNGEAYKLVTCRVRFDDKCSNGHNTFAITGDFYKNQSQINREDPEMGGCCHAEIAKIFPELQDLIQWHLFSTEGPMHYIANTVYLASSKGHSGLEKGEKRRFAGLVSSLYAGLADRAGLGSVFACFMVWRLCRCA